MIASIGVPYNDLQEFAVESGADLFGVADLNWLKTQDPKLLENVPGDYSRAVVTGVRLQKAVLEGLQDRPTPLYFHNYRQTNYQLDRLAFGLADIVQRAGFRALAIPASQIIRRDPMCGHISHKLLGWAAGLGFMGRHNLLVNPEYGAQIRYVSVLTDMPLHADKPREGECGSCRACLKQCPAGAIGETRVDFNLKACYEKLCEFSHLPFVGQHICGVCVKACSGQK